MKKILTLLICACLFGAYSCSDDDNDGDGTGTGKIVKLTVNVTYKSGDKSLPDADAVVYLFENFDNKIPEKWEYIGNGKYKLGDKEQKYYHRTTTNADGVAVFTGVKADAYHTLVIEPNHGAGIKEEFLWKQEKDFSFSYEANPKQY